MRLVLRENEMMEIGIKIKEMRLKKQLTQEELSDKEIAEKAAISPSTVAVHNKKIFKKLGVHSRAELIRLSEQ